MCVFVCVFVQSRQADMTCELRPGQPCKHTPTKPPQALAPLKPEAIFNPMNPASHTFLSLTAVARSMGISGTWMSGWGVSAPSATSLLIGGVSMCHKRRAQQQHNTAAQSTAQHGTSAPGAGFISAIHGRLHLLPPKHTSAPSRKIDAPLLRLFNVINCVNKENTNLLYVSLTATSSPSKLSGTMAPAAASAAFLACMGAGVRVCYININTSGGER